MTCSAPAKCDFSCTAGNCATVICKADTCDQSCTGGGCGLECHGKYCEQSCTIGNCQLQCPSDAETCEQRCTANKDQCTIEYLESSTATVASTAATTTEATTVTTASATGDECEELENRVCYQSCTGGGCDMQCFNSALYDSCEQSCTGEFLVPASFVCAFILLCFNAQFSPGFRRINHLGFLLVT